MMSLLTFVSVIVFCMAILIKRKIVNSYALYCFANSKPISSYQKNVTTMPLFCVVTVVNIVQIVTGVGIIAFGLAAMTDLDKIII
jgi:hypothetical protein